MIKIKCKVCGEVLAETDNINVWCSLPLRCPGCGRNIDYRNLDKSEMIVK